MMFTNRSCAYCTYVFNALHETLNMKIQFHLIYKIFSQNRSISGNSWQDFKNLQKYKKDMKRSLGATVISSGKTHFLRTGLSLPGTPMMVFPPSLCASWLTFNTYRVGQLILHKLFYSVTCPDSCVLFNTFLRVCKILLSKM